MKILHNHKLLGVVFLGLLVVGVWFTYAIFNKKFTDYEKVKLQTSKIGLQLPARADVKIRGVIVGEVLEFDSNAEGAELTLGIYPSEIDTIPENVTGSIVPKTLFGEKYVSLEVPEDPSPEHLKADDMISRTVISTEVEQVLSDLYPLLRTVQPARAQHDPQRALHRPRGPRRAARREPRDRRQLPQAAQPADPRAGRGPAAHRAGLRHLRRRTPRGRADPRRLDHDDRDPRGQGAAAPGAVHRRGVVLRHRAHLPRTRTATTWSASARSAPPSSGCCPATPRSSPASSRAS